MTSGIELLKEQLRNAKIVIKGNYRYIVNPICEQEPPLDPTIIDDCANKLIEKLNFKEANKILTAESMGIPIATAISMKTGIPLIIATKREKRTVQEHTFTYTTGYDEGNLHVNCVEPDDKILLIDDLISTGGTLKCLIEGLEKIGAKIVDVGVIFNKPDYGGYESIKKMGYEPKYLFDVRLNGIKVEIS